MGNGIFAWHHYEDSCEEYSVEFEGIDHETPQAWLLRFDDDLSIWFPKSQCTIAPNDGGPGALTAPAWLLDKNDINYEV